ncbi:MAG: hypothetical protein KAG28_10515 [Cocleimonas sp.]|nr:hypothetical protein [Cocleimonas sp.]
MISSGTIMTLVGLFILAIIVIGLLISITKFYVKVAQGWALIINDTTPVPKVKFTGGIVWPIINKKELMRISLITMELDRRNKEGLICRDNIRADITVAFYLRVNETQEDVLKVAKSIGVDRASDKSSVHELFNAKFSEALKTVGKQMDFISLFENRIGFRDNIIEVIGNDLNGYILEDVAIDYLEQTPKSSLDSDNILDAEGIRKITELTAKQNVQTNILERNEQLAITKKNVETREAMLALERQEADAEARQQREVETIQAREEAETIKVQEEERLRFEQARLTTEEKLLVLEENKQREVEVAKNNRLRAIAIEEEKVTRARELETVSREREVAIQEIEKEKALEVERKEIANVIRERVSVDRTVAEQEEKINDVRVISEAERKKQAVILSAEAKAEEELVKQVKQAEADEIKATYKAKEINTIAQAELEASSKEAEAKIKLAEGTRAEKAAPGLAEAEVKQAHAEAKEKEGLVEAKILQERMTAEAKGIEAQSIAKEKEGLMEAEVLERKLDAEAKGNEKIGLSAAVVTREKFKAEADGLIEKFKAMEQMSPDAREHEEFRMKLDKDFAKALEEIGASKEIAEHQAKVLSTALSKANIDIVGGEGDYFSSFARSLALGKSIEGIKKKSPVVEEVLSKLLSMKGDK